MEPYSWAVEDAALKALLPLPRRRQLRLISAIDLLAAHPFEPGHPSYRASDGTEVFLSFSEGMFVHYALDHAVRKVRIIDIERSPLHT